VKFLKFIIPIVLLFAFSYCRKDKGLTNYGNYPNEVGKIMVNQCATTGCHNAASAEAASGLNLSTWSDLFKGSRSGSPVIPYSSRFSSLCYFINSYNDLGPVNLPTMPINGEKLSREEVQTIKNWIDAGAPDVNGNIKWSDNPNRKKLYVINQGCDVVTVFDSETQLPMRVIDVGVDPNNIESPHMVKVSPDGQYWYVVFTNSDKLQKFRCSDDQLVATVSLGANYDWNTMILTDDGKKAFCVAWAINGHIAAVDVEQMKLIRNYGGYTQAHGVALNAANDMIYVTAQFGNYIYKLDTAFNNVWQISLNGLPPNGASSLDPHELLLSPDKTKFFVTCQNSNEVRVLDIASETVTHVIPTGTYPLEMAIHLPTNRLFVTCEYDTNAGANGSVEVINMSTYSTQNIKVGFLPHGLAVDESKKVLYVASRNIFSNGPAPHHTAMCAGRNGFINFIDVNTLQILKKKTEVSVDPYGIAYRK